MNKLFMSLFTMVLCTALIAQNPGIVVNAGGNRSITLPASTLSISGASYSSNASISGSVYMGWSVISSPAGAPEITITNSTTTTPSFSGFIQGMYMLQFTVVIGSEFNQDIVTVTVNPATT